MTADHTATRRLHQLFIAALVLVLVALIPVAVKNVYFMNVFVLTLMYAALSQSWNILGGYCGQISLGHALYFGIGAYVSTVLFQKFGISPWFGMGLGGMLSASVAVALGYPCFRMKGHYFTIATIVIAEIGLLLAGNWNYIGGELGIQLPISPDSWWTLQFARDKVPYFYVSLGLAAITWLVTFIIEDSRWGYWWRAVKDDPLAAESLGVEVFRSKIAAAGTSAFFTSLVGSVYAVFVAYIDPSSVMEFRFSLLISLPAVLGGIGTLWGPAIGAAILIPLTEFTRSYIGGFGGGLDLIIYGALIMAIALIKPEGVQSLFKYPRRPNHSNVCLEPASTPGKAR